MAPTPVKEIALSRGIDFIESQNPKEPATVGWVKEKAPWLIVTAAYGRIIPPEILDIPTGGAWNVHASILPRWRGAAPIARAIQHGASKTGITIMLMDEGLDTGDILLGAETEIGEDETAGELEERLEKMGCKLLIEAIEIARDGKLEPRPQSTEGVTYAPPIDKKDADIDWSKPAHAVHNHIRAMSPRPGARTGNLKIFRSHVFEGAADGPPGTVKEVDSSGVVVNAGEGLLLVVELQPAGKRQMKAADYARGRKLAPGQTIYG